MIEQRKVYDFLNEEYKEYSNYVIESRAIASCIDGLKITQRKIIYAASKFAKGDKVKVNVLAGMVIANCQYHHGDVSCCDSIINMAQSFKNNLPLLEEIGIYGSLRNPYASSSRYISTKLSEVYKLTFKDEELLENNIVDGFECEYKFFLPIIPMILINGSDGIAVGFSMKIINRDPLDVINSCIKYLKTGKIGELNPKINYFNGHFIKDPDIPKRWIIRGKFDRTNNSVIVNELIPSMTYEKYESILDLLVDKKTIISYKNESKEDIKYVLKFNKDVLSKLDDTSIIKLLKLEEYKTEIYSTIDEHGKLKIFESVEEIITYFIDFRLKYYQKRKEFQKNKSENELKLLLNRGRFIKAIIDNKLEIKNKSKDYIINIIENDLKLDKIDDSYDYLLRMPLYSITKELYEKIKNDVVSKKNQIKDIINMDIKNTYLEDLNELKKKIKY